MNYINKKILIYFLFYLFFSVSSLFCDTNSAITQAADNGGSLGECSTEALASAAAYAQDNGYGKAADAINAELNKRLGVAQTEAFAAENAAATAVEELVAVEQEVKAAEEKVKKWEDKATFPEDLLKDKEYIKEIENLKSLKEKQTVAEQKLSEKADAMEQAYAKLGDVYEAMQYSGDPVKISTGQYSASYRDFEAQDFGCKFAVTRNLKNDKTDEGFGSNWSSPFASRIIRCTSDSLEEIIAGVQELQNFINQIIAICENYNKLFPNYPDERISGYLEKYSALKLAYGTYYELLVKYNETVKQNEELNKYVTYGRFSSPESYKTAATGIIYVDEEDTEHLCLYTDNGLWEPVLAGEKQDFTICSLNLEGQASDSSAAQGGFLVTFANGTKAWYDKYGLLKTKLDNNQNAVKYSYEQGKLKNITLKTGEVLQVESNGAKQITKISGPVSGSAVYVYDNEVLKAVTDNSGITVTFEYDADFDLTKIVKADGSSVQITYGYDSTGRKVCKSVTDENGNTEFFSYNPENKEVFHTTLSGSRELFKYNELGNVIYRKNEDGTEYVFTNDENGLIITETRNGLEYRYSYDDKKQLLYRTESNGGTVSFLYNSSGQLVKSKDEDGFYKDYSYDDKGNVTAVYFCSNLITSCDYYPNGLLKSVSENGCDYTYEYNAYGSLTQKTTRDLARPEFYAQEQWAYDSQNRVIKYTNPAGEITVITYGKNYRCEETGGTGSGAGVGSGAAGVESGAGEGSAAGAWSGAGEVSAVGVGSGAGAGSGAGEASEAGVGSCAGAGSGAGEASAVGVGSGTGAGSSAENLSACRLKREHFFNCRGWEYKLIETDPESGVSYTKESFFDFRGNCTKITMNGNLFALYSYLPSGTLQTFTVLDEPQTAENGRTSYGIRTEYTYDSFGRITLEKKSLVKWDCERESFSLVDDSNPEACPVLNEAKYSFVNTYSVTGGITTVTRTVNNLPYIFKYDNKKRLIVQKNPDGFTKTYSYSKAGRILTETDSNGFITTYSYKSDGTKSSVTKLKNLIAEESAYNEAGLLLKNKAFTGAVTQYEYDGFGYPLKEITDNFITSFAYNQKRQLVKKQICGVNNKFLNDITITYSGGWQITKNGSYISSKNKYDSWNRLVETETAEGLTTYEYNYLGQLIKSTDGNGSVTEYSYNPLNLLSKVQSENEEIEFCYGVDGRLIKTLKNGTVYLKNEYDENSFLISSENFAGEVRRFAYSADGTIESIFNYDTGLAEFFYKNKQLTVTNEKGFSRQKFYNDSGQLIKEIKPDGTEIKTYDLKDETIYRNSLNCIELMENQNTEFGYEYDNSGRLTCQRDKKSGINVNYGYDEFGRLKTKASEYFELEYYYNNCGQVNEIEEKKSGTWVKISESQKVKSFEYSDGSKAFYYYNSLGQLEGQVFKDRLGQIQYFEGVLFNENNRIALVFNSSGNLGRFSYDNRGRLVSEERNFREEIYEAAVKEFIYCGGFEAQSALQSESFDFSSQEIKCINELCSKLKVQFDISAINAGWKVLYTYTKTGSVESETSPAGKIIYEYDENDRIVKKHAEITGCFGIEYKWDDYDCLLKEECQFYKTSYTYQNRTRPESIHTINYQTQTETLIEYTYDSLGRRYSESKNGNKFIILYDGLSVNQTGTIPVFENGRPDTYAVSTEASSGQYRLFQPLESDNFGKSLDSAAITALEGGAAVVNVSFGNTVYFYVDLADGKKINVNFQNLSDNVSVWGCNSNKGFRDYNSSIKSFTSSDPASDGGNYFTYCATDPLNYSDIEGFNKTSITKAQSAKSTAAIAHFLHFDQSTFAKGNWEGLPKQFDCADTSAYINWVAAKQAGIDNLSNALEKFGKYMEEGNYEKARETVNSWSYLEEGSESDYTQLFRGYDRNLLRNKELKDSYIYKQNQIYKDVAEWYMKNPAYINPGTVLVWKKSDYTAKNDSGNWVGHTLTVLARKFDADGNITGFAYLEGHQSENNLTELGFMSYENSSGVNELDYWFGNFQGAYEIESSDAHYEGQIKQNNNCTK